MNVHITGRHFDVTQPLRDHITERLTHLEDHFKKSMDVHVVLHIEKESHIAVATAHIPSLHLEPTINANGISLDDMYAAVDEMIEKLKHQILRQKEKEITERDHGGEVV